MVTSLDFERLFSVSCFEALRVFRIEQQRYPERPAEEIIDILIATETTPNAFDHEAALQLDSLVTDSVPLDGNLFYRECIIAVILDKMPAWASLMRLGRGRFIKRLKANEYRDIRSIFREAKLLESPASQEEIQWWDNIQGRVRADFDRAKMVQAREAERLTLEYEKKRLEKIGIEREPQWISIDDNTVGYDVLSFQIRLGGIANYLIEVKSTTASPARFYVTRNEWQTASEVLENYEFQVWDMNKSDPILHIRSVDQVRPHIPEDNADGKWTVAEIPLGAG